MSARTRAAHLSAMHYTFQESMIFEAGNPPDPQGVVKRVKAKSEERARRRLPSTSIGRVWVRVDGGS